MTAAKDSFLNNNSSKINLSENNFFHNSCLQIAEDVVGADNYYLERCVQLRKWAQQVGLPCRVATEKDLVIYIFDATGLILFLPQINLHHQVNFLSGRSLYRQTLASLRQEPLLKAVKRVARDIPIWDLTAGWGQDAFLLANAGFNVTCVEQHPGIAACLQDALQRLELENPSLAANIKVINIDAKEFLHIQKEKQNENSIKPLIYLDPMFPKNKKSRLVKKPMQILHELLLPNEFNSEGHNLLGHNLLGNKSSVNNNSVNNDNSKTLDAVWQDMQDLWVLAHKIVVKRPRNAEALFADIPEGWQMHSKEGRLGRFDVYASH